MVTDSNIGIERYSIKVEESFNSGFLELTVNPPPPPTRIGSDRIGSDRIGSDRIGSDRVGSGRIGSGHSYDRRGTVPKIIQFLENRGFRFSNIDLSSFCSQVNW